MATNYVLVSTVTGKRGVTSQERQLLRACITDHDTQAVVPWGQSGSLREIKAAVETEKARRLYDAETAALVDARDGR